MFPSKKISIVVADEEPASRRGMLALLSAHERFRVVGHSGAVRVVRELCSEKKPDVLIIDPAMDGGKGLTFIKDVHRWSKGTRVFVIARAADPGTVKRTLDVGARAVATRLDEDADVLNILTKIMEGKVHFSPRVLQLIGEEFASGRVILGDESDSKLSEREREVFGLLAEGQTTSAVAQQLYVSIKTIESHYARIKEKLDVSSMAELRKIAANSGRNQ